MKKAILMLAVAAMAVLTGCTSIDIGKKFNAVPVGETGRTPAAHISVKMTGCYLFGVIPLFCGSVGSAGKTAMFSDTLTTDNGVFLLTRAIRSEGGVRAHDIMTTRNGVFFFPLLSFETLNVSGTGSK